MYEKVTYEMNIADYVRGEGGLVREEKVKGGSPESECRL